MKKLQRQRGFTLVELAIVLTIIGLLLGGILKGQQLINNARVTAQIAQFKAIEAAVTTFSDTYSGLPGDLLTATTRLPNCSAATGCGNGNGDGVVKVGAGAAPAAPTATATVTEPYFFWQHLSDAQLLAGVLPVAVATFGQGLPTSKFSSGGLLVNTLSNAAAPVFNGLYVTVASTNAPVGAAAGTNPGTPGQVAQIDRKLDDGNALTGSVIGLGLAANCQTNAAAGSGGYNETISTKDCAVAYKVQN